MRDTRKTTPGLRALEKYAVRCGGGANHRMGLADAALVKDNHVLAAGGVAEAFAAVRSLEASIPVEIEVDSLDGLRRRSTPAPTLVLLDNFDLDEMRAAVAIRDEMDRAVRPRGERRAHARGRPRRSARPASTSSPSASSPTRPGSSTSASICAPWSADGPQPVSSAGRLSNHSSTACS